MVMQNDGYELEILFMDSINNVTLFYHFRNIIPNLKLEGFSNFCGYFLNAWCITFSYSAGRIYVNAQLNSMLADIILLYFTKINSAGNIDYQTALGDFTATNSLYTFTLNCIATFKCFAYNGNTFGGSFNVGFLQTTASRAYLGFGTKYRLQLYLKLKSNFSFHLEEIQLLRFSQWNIPVVQMGLMHFLSILHHLTQCVLLVLLRL